MDIAKFLRLSGVKVVNGKVRASDIPRILTMAGPKLDDSIDFGLDSSNYNKSELSALLSGAQPILSEGKYTLYSKNDSVFMTDGQSLLYVVEYEIRNLQGFRAISQIKLWRAQGRGIADLKIQGLKLTAFVFFNILLNKADCILTDDTQSDLGRRFWFDRIEDAFSKGLNVYYVENNKVMSKIEDFDGLIELNAAQNIWSADVSSLRKRIAISSKALL